MKQTFAVLLVCVLSFSLLTTRASGAEETSGAPLSHDPPPRRLAVHSTTALGLSGGRFVNELVGARFDLLNASRFAVELDVAYANLEGKDDRVHNVLPQVALRHRFALGTSRFGVPLRFAGGYLPKNGPTVRVAAGVDFDATDAVRLELTPLEPMLWVVRERSELSLNLGANVAFAF
jgi:hypothetical protein